MHARTCHPTRTPSTSKHQSDKQEAKRATVYRSMGPRGCSPAHLHSAVATNQTQEAWVYSHDGPIRRRKRGQWLVKSHKYNAAQLAVHHQRRSSKCKRNVTPAAHLRHQCGVAVTLLLRHGTSRP
eukprot:3097624-Pyramimonas_sp.AAC.1